MAAVTRPQLEARARKLGVDLTAVDLDSITLPADDDFPFPWSEDDDDEVLLLESEVGPPPELETGFANVIIVNNLPIVPVEKFERLERLMRAIYGQIGVIKEGGLWIPTLYTTYGYCFIEYATPQEAELARRKTNAYALDRFHKFRVNMFDDFDKYMEVPEEWTPAEIKPYTPGPNLQRWLMDEKARDQFVIRAGTSTEVYWNDVVPELAYQKQRWTDSFVQWSPLGTYLATVHRQGAQVWGGDGEFKRLMRFPHPLVQQIDFSPGERYLVTYSNHELSNLRDANRWVVLNFFDVRTGKVMRNSNERCCHTCPKCLSWPVMRWSAGGDDHYFAMLGMGTVFVYETKTFSLVDNTSLEIENVVDFSWSPTDSILCIFVQDPGSRIQLATVSLVQIPSKVELRRKHLFSVSDCKMYWQNNGEYLAIQVDWQAEAERTCCTSFELFRIKERGIPSEVFELDNKIDKIIAFAWEPRGSRFAVIHSDGCKHDISFYSMHSADDVSRVSKLTALKDRQADALFWSPAGKFIALAGLKGFNGQLEFYNVDDLETMATTEHPMATDVMWDPTGRFVATASLGNKMGNDIRIWSLIGKQIYKASKEQFSQFQWRPRPPSLLTPEKEKEISTSRKG